MTREKAILCWSGGKDSALALHKIQKSGEYELLALVTTLNGNFRRISMHGVREELLDHQVKAIGLPLQKVVVLGTSNEEYKANMEAMLLKYKALGANKVIFGDIFLEDLRAWRDKNLASVGMTGVYPLWKMETRKLADEFISLGFKSAICCVNEAYLPKEAVGCDIDREFIDHLPPGVDPCGENGEFHSFVYEGPIFKENLRIVRGEKVFRPMPAPSTTKDSNSYNCEPARKSLGFWFCDLIAESDRKQSPREKVCPKCGATFSCGAQVVGERCWCNALPPMPPPIEKDCFCPQCLKDEVAKRTAPQ